MPTDENQKKNRRSKAKYPALKPNLNLKTRFDELDFDYLHKLSTEELAWFNKFVSEEILADFRYKGRKLNKKKDRKRIYDKNNARNRDILTRSNASHRTVYFSELNSDVGTNYELEKAVYKIDEEKKLEKKLKASVQNQKKTENQ